MSNNIILSGSKVVFNLFKRFIKTPEERRLLNAQTDDIKNDDILKVIKRIAKDRTIELEILKSAINMFERIGYTKDEIKELVGPNIEKLVESCNDIENLNKLAQKGVVLKLDIKVNKDDDQ